MKSLELLIVLKGNDSSMKWSSSAEKQDTGAGSMNLDNVRTFMKECE